MSSFWELFYQRVDWRRETADLEYYSHHDGHDDGLYGRVMGLNEISGALTSRFSTQYPPPERPEIEAFLAELRRTIEARLEGRTDDEAKARISALAEAEFELGNVG